MATITKLVVGLSLLVKTAQAAKICGLCGSSFLMPQRWDFPVVTDVTPWKTCRDIFFELGYFNEDDPMCSVEQQKYQAVCCDDEIPPGWETPPTPSPILATGNEPICKLCGNDEFPGNPDKFISARYIGSFDCASLYHRGLNGLIPGFMCGPLQDYAYEKCGCGPHNPNKPSPPPTPQPTLPATPSPTLAPTPEGCTLIDGWRDEKDNPCSWYEENEPEGCPNWGWYISTDGVSASDACCHCADDSGIDKSVCIDKAGWKDNVGLGCDWYMAYEPEGCPNWSWYPGKAGLNAGEACCHCAKNDCLNQLGWKDDSGTDCRWYEDNEPKGCPKWSWYPGQGTTAGEACCHCQCDNLPGWIDHSGTGCEWYETHEPAGCPKWGWYPGSSRLMAREACCHCQT